MPQPTTEQLNARNAAVGAPQTGNGAYNGPANPSVYGTVQNGSYIGVPSLVTGAATPTPPGLTARFNYNAGGTMQAPAVVTSDKAEEHIGNMATAVQTAQTDTNNLQNHTANVKAAANAAAAPANTETAKSDTATPTPSTGVGDYDTAVKDLLGGLSDNLSNTETAQPNEQQQDVINQDNTQIAADQQLQQQTSDAIASMSTGTFPLTPDEQNLVNNVGVQYSGALRDAQAYSFALSQGAMVNAAATGIQMYSPNEALSRIDNAANVGSKKVAEVNSNILSKMQKLTDSLQKGDYKGATDLYKAIGDDIKTRSKEIDDINKSVNDGIKQMRTDAVDYAKTAIAALTSVGRLDATTAKNTADNLYRQGVLDEKTRHDIVQEAISAEGTKKGTQAERAASALSQFGAAFVPGARFNGTPTIDSNGFATPAAWKAALEDAPNEGLDREQFIKQFGYLLYTEGGKISASYGLTPQEQKLVTGALP